MQNIDILDHHEAVNFLIAIDEDWARLIETVGPCLYQPKAEREPYDALIRAVAYQQLHGRAAEAILARLMALYQGNMPTPGQLLATDFDTLRACGFSGRKIETIRGIAQGVLDGLVPSREIADDMPDEQLITQLAQLKGIGHWTVEMLLMFTLGRTDILPIDDFGVREGYRRMKSLDVAPTPKVLRSLGEAWSPYRTIASWYLWRAPKPVQ
jgi:DNA-3-methyladenine glycosylase II